MISNINVALLIASTAFSLVKQFCHNSTFSSHHGSRNVINRIDCNNSIVRKDNKDAIIDTYTRNIISDYIDRNYSKIGLIDMIIIRITCYESLLPMILPSSLSNGITAIGGAIERRQQRHNNKNFAASLSSMLLQSSTISIRITCNESPSSIILPSSLSYTITGIGGAIQRQQHRHTNKNVVASLSSILLPLSSMPTTDNNHMNDILLRVLSTQFPQVVIDIHVIAFLHIMLYSISVSSQFLQVSICVPVVTFSQYMFNTSLISVRFASLSCNPYLGSRGCIRHLLLRRSISIPMRMSHFVWILGTHAPKPTRRNGLLEQ